MTLQDDFPNNKSTTGTFAVGKHGVGNFERPLDSDWFAIDLQAGTRYLFNLRTDSGPISWERNVALKVFGADGRELSDIVEGDGQYHLTPTLEFSPATSGTYFIAASSSSYLGPLGTYRLTAAIRDGADDYSADTGTTAQMIANSYFTGKFEVVGDVDWIKFHADVGLNYQFQSQASPFVSPNLVLVRDKSGAIISAGSFNPAESGDYFVSVLGLRDGEYSVKFQTSPDDYSGNTMLMGAIAPGARATGKIDFRFDQDRFKLSSLEAGKIYTVTLTGDSAAFGLDVQGTDLAGIAATSGNPATGAVTLTFTAQTSGDAYINVETDIYTVFKNPLNYAISVSSPAGDDVGDTATTASQLGIGQSFSGLLQGRGDIDVFKSTLQAGVTYSLALTGTNLFGSAQIKLTGADGLQQTIDRDGLKHYTFTPAKTGEYYAAVSADYGSTSVAYQLNLGQPADDIGASAASARDLPIGTSLSGVLEPGGGDRDWYKVALTAGTTYWFKAAGVSPFLMSGALRILDASGKELAAAGSDYAGLADTLAFKTAIGGTYYVEMYSPSRNVGTYTMTASVGKDDDYGSTNASAKSITLGTELTGQLEIASDKDTFKLNVEAGKTYAFKVSAASDSFDLNLKDAAGQSLTFLGNPGIQRDVHVFTANTSGSVYLTVGNAGSEEDGRSYKLSAFDYGVDDSGSTKATATTLAIGATRQGRIDYIGDKDMFRVSLQAGQSYVFSAPDIKVEASYFSLVDASGISLGTASNDTLDRRISYTAAQSGDYYLSMAGTSWGTGTYSLKAAQLSGDSVGPSMVSSSIANGATNVALTSTGFKMVYNESIAIDASLIRVLDSGGKAMAFFRDESPRVSDNTLTFKLVGSLAPGSSYTIELPHGAIRDLAGNAHSGPEMIKFSTLVPTAIGTAGNDVFSGGINGLINGGAGIDTVEYTGNYYRTVTRIADKVEVKTHANGAVVTDTLQDVERLRMNGSMTALDVDGNGGQAYRLYRAAFNRTPDQEGLGFWIKALDNGYSLSTVARNFVDSPEFQSLYGAAPDNSAFITLLYKNVLNRAPDAEGFKFWNDAMHNGITRERVLGDFSESAENVNALASIIGNGFTYTPYLG
ncbi:MAG: pilin protein MshA [Pseudoduganella sp.]|jgi:hypothetical protein|nr:pilin protein MshA [Pseudoduganella sp.]